MKGSITWLEATEENVREIPNKIEVIGRLSKCIYAVGWINKQTMRMWADGYDEPFDITHFAYINEPE